MIGQSVRRTDIANPDGAVERDLVTVKLNTAGYTPRTSHDDRINGLVMETYTGVDGNPKMTIIWGNTTVEKHEDIWVLGSSAHYLVVDPNDPAKIINKTTLDGSETIVGQVIGGSKPAYGGDSWRDARQITCFETNNGVQMSTVTTTTGAPSYDGRIPGQKVNVSDGTNITESYIWDGTNWINACCGGASGPTAPVMGGAGTTTVANITNSGADFTGTYTSDGGDAVTATGFIVYASGTPAANQTIADPATTTFTDGTLPSPITATGTGLTQNTNYCIRPYATNSIGTSYGDEECFTTLAFTIPYSLFPLGTSRFDITTNTTGTNTDFYRGEIATLGGYDYVIGGAYSGIKDISYIEQTAAQNITTAYNAYIENSTALASDGNYLYAVYRTSPTSSIQYEIIKFEQVVSGSPALQIVTSGVNSVASQGYSSTILGNNLFIGSDNGNVIKVDLTTFTISSTASFGSGQVIDMTNDGTNVYAAVDNTIVKINPSTMGVAGTYTYVDGSGTVPDAIMAIEYNGSDIIATTKYEITFNFNYASRILRVNTGTMTSVTAGTVATSFDQGPFGIMSLKKASDGFFYAGTAGVPTQGTNGRIYRLNNDGTVVANYDRGITTDTRGEPYLQ